MDPQRFPPEFFGREDESNDAEFYTMPRLVVHIDDGAIVAVGRLFQQLIPENARGAGPDEQLAKPTGRRRTPRRRIVGLGMNATEMADNPQLDEYVLKDINVDPSLPFADESFDAVVITVSVQYLTRPVESVRRGVAHPAARRRVHRNVPPTGAFPPRRCASGVPPTTRITSSWWGSICSTPAGSTACAAAWPTPIWPRPEDPLFAVYAYKESGGESAAT